MQSRIATSASVSAGTPSVDETDLVPVAKDALHEHFMLVLEDPSYYARFEGLSQHDLRGTHRVVAFSSEIREALATGDLPILERFGREDGFYLVDLEFPQFIYVMMSWIRIFYDSDSATPIRTTLPPEGLVLDSSDTTKCKQYQLLEERLLQVYSKQEAREQVLSEKEEVEISDGSGSREQSAACTDSRV